MTDDGVVSVRRHNEDGTTSNEKVKKNCLLLFLLLVVVWNDRYYNTYTQSQTLVVHTGTNNLLSMAPKFQKGPDLKRFMVRFRCKGRESDLLQRRPENGYYT